MRRLVSALCLGVIALPSFASVDGEVAWTKLSFCNGARYCVDIESKEGRGIDSLRVTHSELEIEIPINAISIRDVDTPLLSEVRLLSVQRRGGAFGNTLEIPYLIWGDGSPVRSVMKLNFDQNDKWASGD